MPTIFQANQLPTRAVCWHDESTVLTGAAMTPPLVNNAQPYSTYAKQSAGVNGDSFSSSVFLKAGIYTFTALGIAGADAGILDWYLDGVAFITGQDWYSAGYAFAVVKLGSVTISADGYHVLKGIVNGKNASSTGYVIYLTQYWFKQGSD